MDRQTLAQLLESGTEAWSMCRASLLQGPRFQIYADADSGTHANVLASIYSARLSLADSRGTWTVGFAEAVAQLRNADARVLKLVSVDTDEPRRHFQLFLDEGLTAVIACLGIEAPPHGRRQYRIERGDKGELRLYRGDDLVDVDHTDDGDSPSAIKAVNASTRSRRCWSNIVRAIAMADCLRVDFCARRYPGSHRHGVAARRQPGVVVSPIATAPPVP